MKALRFVVTAGPTREYLDPVRFLSNPSTGRMGFAVARAARAAGHEVVLIAGPVAQRHFIHRQTASQRRQKSPTGNEYFPHSEPRFGCDI